MTQQTTTRVPRDAPVGLGTSRREQAQLTAPGPESERGRSGTPAGHHSKKRKETNTREPAKDSANHTDATGGKPPSDSSTAHHDPEVRRRQCSEREKNKIHSATDQCKRYGSVSRHSIHSTSL